MRALLVGLIAFVASGCFDTSSTCEDLRTCAPPADGGTDATDAAHVGDAADAHEVDAADAPDASQTPNDGDASHEASEAGDAVIERACDAAKRPIEDPCVIDGRFGVFVSPAGSDTGDGSRAQPLKTLRAALLKAHSTGLRVYACDDGTGYSEAITLDAAFDGAELFGGFDCAQWSYATTRRITVKPASGIPLTVRGASDVLLEDVEFRAPDATAPGASSIGAVVDSATAVVLRRVKLTAGNGAAGQPGADGAKGDDGQMAGSQQHGADALCPSGQPFQAGGFWNAASACGSLGGNGGAANKGNVGSPGVPGVPDTNVTPPSIDNSGARGPDGADGQPGSPGNAGVAGAATMISGAFSNTGYSPAPAAGNGSVGFPGQGGGGGGASNASGVCIGASGGAGGMGGCGGQPGTGGAGGGASVALLAWMSGVTLDVCELVSGNGGAGGKGGNGGPGGAGADGAPGGAAYVVDGGASIGKGGKGGRGGDGGPGGAGAGGNGGHSYAVVYRGQPPARINNTMLTAGNGGVAGVGAGSGTRKAPDGISGDFATEYQASSLADAALMDARTPD